MPMQLLQNFRKVVYRLCLLHAFYCFVLIGNQVKASISKSLFGGNTNKNNCKLNIRRGEGSGRAPSPCRVRAP